MKLLELNIEQFTPKQWSDILLMIYKESESNSIGRKWNDTDICKMHFSEIYYIFISEKHSEIILESDSDQFYFYLNDITKVDNLIKSIQRNNVIENLLNS